MWHRVYAAGALTEADQGQKGAAAEEIEGEDFSQQMRQRSKLARPIANSAAPASA